LLIELTLKDLVSFKVASIVFWISFCFNQRGCEKTVRGAIFRQLTSYKATFVFRNRKPFESIFYAIYDTLIQSFVEAIDDLSQSWQATEAGKAFIECFKLARFSHFHSYSKSRKYKRAYPPLTEKDLKSWTRPVEDGNTFAGLENGVDLTIMSDFWSLILVIMPTTELKPV
jgi:hypothetical protein